MSSSEQLTLGAKLCAILIRHSRSLSRSPSLSLFRSAKSSGTDDRVHRVAPLALFFSPTVTAYPSLSFYLFLLLAFISSYGSLTAASQTKIRGRRKGSIAFSSSSLFTRTCTNNTSTTSTRRAALQMRTRCRARIR